jgi:hypothetical protein
MFNGIRAKTFVCSISEVCKRDKILASLVVSPKFIEPGFKTLDLHGSVVPIEHAG